MSASWPWYTVVEGNSLGQGDILRSVQLLVPLETATGAKETLSAEVLSSDVIVMTPECDLQQKSVTMVVVCEVVSFARFALRDPELSGHIARTAAEQSRPVPAERATTFEKDAWELLNGTKPAKALHDEIAKERRPAYCLLREHESEPPLPRSVVSFHRVHAHPRALLGQAAAAQRLHLRLLPPYRDFVSRAFGMFFSRVGLFEDLPRLK